MGRGLDKEQGKRDLGEKDGQCIWERESGRVIQKHLGREGWESESETERQRQGERTSDREKDVGTQTTHYLDV